MVYVSNVIPGQMVMHPFFKEGYVVKVENKKTTAMLTIDFGKHGIRVIEEEWLKKHGAI